MDRLGIGRRSQGKVMEWKAKMKIKDRKWSVLPLKQVPVGTTIRPGRRLMVGVEEEEEEEEVVVVVVVVVVCCGGGQYLWSL